jgi:hypothetical protein
MKFISKYFIILLITLLSIKAQPEAFPSGEFNGRDGLEATNYLCEASDQETIGIINSYIEQNKTSLSAEEIRLIKFISGNCLPVVWISGLYSNKLQLIITDCELLKKFHPDIAEACGFDKKCSNGEESLFWITEKFETNNGSTCFGHLMKLNFKKNPNDKGFTEQEYYGFKLTFYGNTPQTKAQSECGFGASCNLFDKMFYFGKQSIYGALFFKDHLKSLGYQIGFNLFSVPVDFRRTPSDPYNHNLIKDAVDLAYEINKKPVIVIGHSYGSLMALDYIYTLSPEDKQEKIARFMALGSPMLGSYKTLKPLILGNDEFNIHVKIIMNIVDLFISMENQRIIQNGSPSLFQLVPKTFWKLHEGEEWMKLILARARVENDISKCVQELYPQLAETRNPYVESQFLGGEITGPYYSSDNPYIHKSKVTQTSDAQDAKILDTCIYPIINKNVKVLRDFKDLLPFFPDLEFGCGDGRTSDSTCSKSHNCKSTIWDKYCRLNFFIPLDEAALEVKEGDEVFKYDMLTYDSIKEIIKRYGIGKFDLEFYDYMISELNHKLEVLDHPGVPVTVYYMNTSRTVVKVKLDRNPKDLTDKDIFVPEALGDSIYDFYGGDGTVPSASHLLPPLKWSVSKESRANPIHFVEYCSNTDYKEQTMDFKKNQYLNVECRCETPSDDRCSHPSFITDQHLIDHLSLYIHSENYKSTEKTLRENIDIVGRGVSEKMNCQNLNKLYEEPAESENSEEEIEWQWDSI